MNPQYQNIIGHVDLKLFNNGTLTGVDGPVLERPEYMYV